MLPRYLSVGLENLKSDLHLMIDLRKLLIKGVCRRAATNINKLPVLCANLTQGSLVLFISN
jgi:hypothetical protein